MTLRGFIKRVLRALLSRVGFEIIPRSLAYDWQTGDLEPVSSTWEMPQDAKDVLRPDHPRLLELQASYQNGEYPCSEVLIWDESRVSAEDMLYFRGHNAYVFQEGPFNRNLFGYLLAYYYIKTIDNSGLLERLEEDQAFGAITYRFGSRLVSRDLLDSILEIYFLDRHLGLFDQTNFTVLDIGAGYGRLAHRMCEALPGLNSYICADAIPVSSFLAEYYLSYRGLESRAGILPLNRIPGDLDPGSIDLAVNIHSFSECTLPAIRWWLSVLQQSRVPNLMIVPNSGPDLYTNDGQDFLPLVEEFGYQQQIVEPKYLDPAVQKYALNPDHFHLFRLAGA